MTENIVITILIFSNLSLICSFFFYRMSINNQFKDFYYQIHKLNRRIDADALNVIKNNIKKG